MNSHYLAPFAAQTARALADAEKWPGNRAHEPLIELRSALILLGVTPEIVVRAAADVRRAAKRGHRLPYSAALRCQEARQQWGGTYGYDNGDEHFSSKSLERVRRYECRIMEIYAARRAALGAAYLPEIQASAPPADWD